jgi:hypothetical protein
MGVRAIENTIYYRGYNEASVFVGRTCLKGASQGRVAVFKKTIPSAIPHLMRPIRSAEFGDAARARNMRKAAQAAS